MLEKFESGLIDSFCHFYFMYFVFLEGVFVAHDYIARQVHHEFAWLRHFMKEKSVAVVSRVQRLLVDPCLVDHLPQCDLRCLT
uniref:Uncharacterized protein n=1 Tax=Solanum lycopersicum TaxID=4081 RepID=A0A3Q7ENP5_SOLLC